MKPGGISEESIAKISSTLVPAAIFTLPDYLVRSFLSVFAGTSNFLAIFMIFLRFSYAGICGVTTELGGYRRRSMSTN